MLLLPGDLYRRNRDGAKVVLSKVQVSDTGLSVHIGGGLH